MNETKLTDRVANLSPAKRALLEKHLRERGFQSPPLQTIPRRVEREFAPLSFAQQRLWFLNQLEPESPAYNEGSALRLTGHLDLDALHKAINHIVKRHEVLRTNFVTVDGNPMQKIAHRRTVEIPCIDLSSHAGEERDAEVERLIGETIRRPFDLTQDLMLRPLLIRLADRQHIIMLVKHHIASDGWSSGIFRRELSVLYEAFAKGETPALPEPPIQYADYAVWQREWLQGETLESHLSYWKKQLSGVPALKLPTDRPRPAAQTYRGAKHSLALPLALTDQLKTLSRREGVTLFMTLLAAFQSLLNRYSGQDDFPVGSAIAGRTRAETEALIGFFVNTLVLRADFSGNPTFRDFLARVRKVALEAYNHQDLPFEKLVEELNPDRDLGSTPLFQVWFALQNTPRPALELSGLTAQPMEVGSGIAKFDLVLSMVETPGGLTGCFEYITDLFEPTTIERMSGHFRILLEAIAANPEQRVADLPILTEAEKHRLLVEWNDTKKDYPEDKCVQELFEEQAERMPDAVAVIFEDRQLTYRELNVRANHLAHYLKKRGVGPDAVVGICTERSVEMVVGLLGILKAGGAYAPLDPAYPQERLAFMLEDARALVLLTERLLAEKLPRSGVQVIFLDTDWELMGQESRENPASGVTAENLAYVIYTSGSTGKPKAVTMSHGSLCNLIAWQRRNFKHPVQARTLQFASLSFDVSFQELFTTWCSGGTLVLVPEELRRDSPALLRYLNDESIERVFLPFVALQRLAEAADERAPIPAHLREIITAGEQLQITPAIADWFRKLENCALDNQYGPSESHVVTSFALAGSPADWPALPPIGRPIANSRIYILDRCLNLVPIGVPGELYIGGECLARAYLNRPEQTAERFIPNPFSAEPGARLYRTGDLARYLPDGNIEFLGRIDHQVKIRGFRIELGEIESVLAQHPAVREAAVTSREDTPSDPSTALGTGKRLVAYVVPNTDLPCSTLELRSFLKEKLPDYMIPSAFVLLDILPLTPSGKVDRNALPAPDRSRPELEDGYVAPRSAVEELLAEIWAGVLKLDKIGIHDNFFDLGGHSLLATQLVSRIRESFQVEFPLRTLFETPTVIGLAEQIEETRPKEQGVETLPMLPVSREKNFPLSFAQQRLWFLDQLEPGSTAYNVREALRLRGSLDVAALEQSLHEIIRRHESLRTTFAMIEGEPVQVIAPSLGIPLSVVDLTDYPESEREDEARRLSREEAQRPFDIAQGPLLRVSLLRLSEQDHVLLLTMHHIVSDGWSIGVLYRELSVLYEAFSNEHPSPLPDLPIQYADFSVWQRNWLQGEVLESQLSYWKKQLEGSPAVLNLPTDRSRTAVQSHRGARQSIVVCEELTQSLKALSRKQGVTLFMTLLAAFQTLLHRYTGQDDIVVGSPIGNRNRTEIEGLIGFFVNTLVLRNELSGNPTFRELLHRVREVALGAYAHQDIPFEKLVEELQPERSLSHSPLFQVMFVFQNAASTALRFEGLSVSPVRVSGETAKFDLTLSMHEEGQGLRGSLQYNTDLFDNATITRMLGHFQVLLEGIATTPEQCISDLPILTQAERHRLLVEWNDTKREYPKDKCIHELFEEQVERSPDAVAVVFEDQQLSYRELNQQANQVAHYLRRLGVGPETLVGVCMERSLEMIIGLLGILKAGGAYVPLDPDYPKERLVFMLKDTQARVLLTQERLVEKLPDRTVHLIRIDKHWEEITGESYENLETGATAENLAYVNYTSGSTGEPRGVEVLHRGVLRLLFGVEYVHIDKSETFLHLASTSFDASTFEIWGPLLHGAKCVLFPGTVPSPTELGQLFHQHKVSTLWLASSLFNTVIDEAPDALSGVRQLLIGGEALSVPQVRRALALLPQAQIINGYGPTESTTFTCCCSIPRELDQSINSVSIGRPISNTKVYLLDANLSPVPIGVTGELCIGGDGLARGYLNRPELTAEKFIPNPFSSEPGARLYRTGDLARYLPDGNIEFLGRIDNQVKIRGFRIELGEIEAVLEQHAAVRDAVVLAREDVSGDKRLVGYIVPNQEPTPTPHDLRSYLKEKLPQHMVPSAFVFLDSLPLTPNGKVDRRALPAPDENRPELKEAFVKPRTSVEELLAGIWAEVLKLEKVGIHDNFFDLGGHSLKATQVMSRVREALRVDLPLRVMFEAPTIAELASIVEQSMSQSYELEELVRNLAEVESLPEEEIEQQLAKKNKAEAK